MTSTECNESIYARATFGFIGNLQLIGNYMKMSYKIQTNSIRKFIAKVRETGFIVEALRRERARAVENIKVVAETSSRQELNISRSLMTNYKF